MVYLIYHKETRNPKDEYEINYYLEINRKSINVIYEYLGLYLYDFRRYMIFLNYNVQNEYQIVRNVIINAEKIYENFNQVRKLAIMAKFVVYIVSKINNIPLYKLIKDVTYEMNGEIMHLSPHAFINSTYNLIPRFEKLLS